MSYNKYNKVLIFCAAINRKVVGAYQSKPSWIGVYIYHGVCVSPTHTHAL